MNCTFFILGDFNFDHLKLSTCERLSCAQNLLNEYNTVVRDNFEVNRGGLYLSARKITLLFIY